MPLVSAPVFIGDSSPMAANKPAPTSGDTPCPVAKSLSPRPISLTGSTTAALPTSRAIAPAATKSFSVGVTGLRGGGSRLSATALGLYLRSLKVPFVVHGLISQLSRRERRINLLLTILPLRIVGHAGDF